MLAQRRESAKDEQQDLRLAFKMFDLDGDGCISTADLKAIMGMLGNDLTEHEVDIIYSHLDTNANGLIDFEEFEAILFPNYRRPNMIVKQKQKKRSQKLAVASSKLAIRPSKDPINKTNKLTSSNINASLKTTVKSELKTQLNTGSGMYNNFYNDQSANRNKTQQSRSNARSGGGML